MTSTQVELDNIEVIRKGYEAFGAGDMAALGDLFAPEAVWRAEPTGVLRGTYEGRDAIFAHFAQIGQETAGTFRAIPTAMAASGNKVFVETAASGERQGRTLETNSVNVFTVVDGLVREVVLYQSDYAKDSAFWA
jgi:uncharacterized protein